MDKITNGLTKKYLIVCNRWTKAHNDPVVITKRFNGKGIIGWIFPKYHLSYLYSDCFLLNGIQARYYYAYLKAFAWFSNCNLKIVEVDQVLNKQSVAYELLHKKLKFR